jgi:uncharacterized protein
MNKPLGLLFIIPLLVQSAYISIIIDDMGANYQLGIEALELPSEVAMSILPHQPHSKDFAIKAHAKGMDVLLHQPMQSYEQNHLLGQGALLTGMEKQQFLATLRANLAQVPYVIGVNNHMGSQLTSETEAMSWLMQELKRQDLFFVDSRTSASTVALDTALKTAIPALRRRVFLDHDDNVPAIMASLDKLVEQAQQHGHAIAIGHPRKNTLAALERFLPELAKHQVKLIKVSDYLYQQQQSLKRKQLDRINPFYRLELIHNVYPSSMSMELISPCWVMRYPCDPELMQQFEVSNAQHKVIKPD